MELFLFVVCIITIIAFIAIIRGKDEEIARLNRIIKNLVKQIEELKALNNNSNHNEQKIDNNVISNNINIVKNEEELRRIEEKRKQEKLQEIENNKQKQLEEAERRRLEKERVERAEQERKNTLILLTGSILIILAAVVFLMGAWSLITNFTKTILLALGIFIFIGSSKIAENKFRIEKTAKTFFYLAMAYIPLFMISISVLGLFGNYLSINGEGKYLYFCISSIILSIIYYTIYKLKNEKSLFYGSLVAQCGSVILLSLSIATDLRLIIINLLLYNFILIINYYKDEKMKIICYIIPFTLAVFIVFNVLVEPIKDIYTLASFVLLAFNYGIFALKESESIAFKIVFDSLVFGSGMYTTLIYMSNLGTKLQIILSLIYIFNVYVILMLFAGKNQKYTISTFLTTIAFNCFIGIFMLAFPKNSRIPIYVVCIDILGIFLLSYKLLPGLLKDLIDYLTPIITIVAGVTGLVYYNANIGYYIVYSLIIWAISELLMLRKDNEKSKIWHVISHIYLCFTFLLLYDEINWLEIVILDIVYIYSFLRHKSHIFKYLGYSVIFWLIFYFNLPINNIAILMMLTTSIIIILEEIIKALKDDFSVVYLSILKISIFLMLIFVSSKVCGYVGILYVALLLVINKKNSDTDLGHLDIIPLLGFLGIIYNKNIFNDEAVATLLLGISTLLLTVYSFAKRRISLYTISALAYMLLLRNNFYNLGMTLLYDVIFCIWSFIITLSLDSEKQKDFFKVISCFALTKLYYSIIDLLELNKTTLFNFAGIIFADIYLFKKILEKYFSGIEVLESISLAFIYLIAIFNYQGDVDGLLFSILIISILVFSYWKKYGSIFIVSILAIIFNAILLTRAFWVSLPWWLYLLGAGGFLIFFAGKNESMQNKNIGIVQRMKDLKDKIDGK